MCSIQFKLNELVCVFWLVNANSETIIQIVIISFLYYPEIVMFIELEPNFVYKTVLKQMVLGENSIQGNMLDKMSFLKTMFAVSTEPCRIWLGA